MEGLAFLQNCVAGGAFAISNRWRNFYKFAVGPLFYYLVPRSNIHYFKNLSLAMIIDVCNISMTSPTSSFRIFHFGFKF